MALTTIPRRIVSYGPPLPLDGFPSRPTYDASPPSLTAAVQPSMREVWRGPNVGSYSLLVDSATNEMVLYGYPITEAPHAGEPRPPRIAEAPGAEKLPPHTGSIYNNPDGRETLLAPMMAAPRTLRNGDEEWDRATGATKDSASLAFEAKIHRLRTGIRMRQINDTNRRHFGQAPVDPNRAA